MKNKNEYNFGINSHKSSNDVAVSVKLVDIFTVHRSEDIRPIVFTIVVIDILFVFFLC